MRVRFATGLACTAAGNAFALRGGTNTPPDYLLDPLLVPSALRPRRPPFQQWRDLGGAIGAVGGVGRQPSTRARRQLDLPTNLVDAARTSTKLGRLRKGWSE